jgi:tetratricopeptide (TPR) repeat protein
MNMKNGTAIILLVVGLAAPLCWAERTENELPMYGGKHNPEVKQNKEFSASAAKLGWQYYYRGDLDTAIKRFNQAWMFDRQSAEAFWGFGLIMGRRSDKEDAEQNIREAIRFLEMAASRQANNPNILVDLGYSCTGLGVLLKDKGDLASTNDFLKARAAFERAERLNPDLPPLHSNWSVLEFSQGNYQKAKERLDRAKKLGFKPDPAYVKSLENKLRK